MPVSNEYLNNVLGVTSVVVPEGTMAPRPLYDVTGDLSQKLAVISFSPVALSERELCQKMLMAAGAGPLLLVEFSSSKDLVSLKDFFGQFEGQFLWVFGEVSAGFKELAAGRVILELPQLNALMDQSDPEALLQKKKKVWADIQKFQREYLA